MTMPLDDVCVISTAQSERSSLPWFPANPVLFKFASLCFEPKENHRTEFGFLIGKKQGARSSKPRSHQIAKKKMEIRLRFQNANWKLEIGFCLLRGRDRIFDLENSPKD